MSTITKEQLIRRAHLTVSMGDRELEKHPDRDGVAADIKIASIAARSLMAEPIYQLWDEGYYDTEKETYDAAIKAGGRGRIVYTAPPAPVSVPTFEEWCESTEQKPVGWVRDAMKEAYNGCRTAMLQGAENAESPTTMQTAPSLYSSPKNAESASSNSPVIPDCSCRTCRPVTMTDMRFVVCPECGNKRCPHANDHRNACTGSNEPGQEGSAYPAAPKREVK